MSVGVSLKILGKGWEVYWGKSNTKWVLIAVSGTIFTIAVELAVKI